MPQRRQRQSERTVLQILIAGCVGIVLGGIVGKAAEACTLDEAIQTIHPLTIQILKVSDALEHASASERSAKLENLLDLLDARRDALLTLMETHPATVLEVALPDAVRRSFSPTLKDRLEQETTVDGELEVTIASDFQLQTSQVAYTLITPSGQRLHLHFAGKGPELLTGSHIRVHGVQLEQDVALAAATSTTSSTTSSVQTLSAALPNTFGAQKTLVLLVNFSDNAVQPYTLAAAQSTVFTTTSNFDWENSYQQTWLIGDVFGWYTIPLSSTVCDYNTLASQAKSAAQAAGVNLANYNRYVYAFPQNACTWWGLGTVGGNPSNAWINGSLQMKVVSHEMGHNFGLYHSHSLDCGTTVIGTNCTASEYGDTIDTMGNPAAGHFTAFQKERLGWVNYNVSPPITTVQTSGTYSLDPYESLTANPKALKILKSTDATTKQKTFYYLELRRAVGMDSFLSTNGNVLNGIVAHTGSESSGDTSYLLDMTPATSSWSDPALDVGQSFSDSAAGITITPRTASDSGASVDIQFGPSTCTLANPVATLAPSSQWSVAGQPLTYTMTVTNANTSACADAVFGLSPALPSGWSQSPATANLTVASGASATQAFSVTSPSTAAAAFYTVSETATNSANASYGATASATYTVQVPDTTPPTVTITAPTNGATLPKKGTVKISATASDASGISRIDLLVDQKVLTSCLGVTSCSASWSMNRVATGSHTITANASDNASPTANSASVSISVVK